MRSNGSVQRCRAPVLPAAVSRKKVADAAAPREAPERAAPQSNGRRGHRGASAPVRALRTGDGQ